MIVFPFERSGDLMTVTARVWGAHTYRELILVIDTGAAATSIEPAILKELGIRRAMRSCERVFPRRQVSSTDTCSGCVGFMRSEPSSRALWSRRSRSTISTASMACWA